MGRRNELPKPEYVERFKDWGAQSDDPYVQRWSQQHQARLSSEVFTPQLPASPLEQLQAIAGTGIVNPLEDMDWQAAWQAGRAPFQHTAPQTTFQHTRRTQRMASPGVRPIIMHAVHGPLIGEPHQLHGDVINKYQQQGVTFPDEPPMGLVHDDLGHVEWYNTLPDERAQRLMEQQTGRSWHHSYEDAEQYREAIGEPLGADEQQSWDEYDKWRDEQHTRGYMQYMDIMEQQYEQEHPYEGWDWRPHERGAFEQQYNERMGLPNGDTQPGQPGDTDWDQWQQDRYG